MRNHIRLEITKQFPPPPPPQKDPNVPVEEDEESIHIL